jgi:inner membrane transporter RhtA
MTAGWQMLRRQVRPTARRLVAVAATAVAFSLSLASLSRITPTEFAVTSTLEPALAAVAAALFLGVTLRAPQYAGGALTILAVLLLASADARAP